jgi:predicted TIM-barrel fold metal-dependent hydrolase
MTTVSPIENGKAAMKIDIHSHIMSVAFVEHLLGRDSLPAATREGNGFVTQCAPLLAIRLGAPILDLATKLDHMDQAGIDVAVLSTALPYPATLGGAEADFWAARLNDELAAIVAAHPARFAAWANLGFGDPQRTVTEIDRCLDELGLAGFQVFSNIAGRALDAPDVLPVLEHIASRHAPVHLHPTWPANGIPVDPSTMLGLAFPSDTSLGVLRLIGAGLFDRQPIIVASHLGGTLPWLRERLAIYGRDSAPFPNQRPLERPVVEYLDLLNVDTVTYGPASLQFAYTQLGAERMLFGTDHPFGDPDLPNQLIDRLACTSADRGMILAGNALRLLQLRTDATEPTVE